jgi:hypothetical protein
LRVLGIDSSPFSMPTLYLRNAFFLSRKPGPLQVLRVEGLLHAGFDAEASFA